MSMEKNIQQLTETIQEFFKLKEMNNEKVGLFLSS